MKTLVPIRVRIGTKPNGRGALYPDFNLLPVVAASGMDWSEYVDVEGDGWCYDKTSGHREESTGGGFDDSPAGTQWGCLLVPQQFATEAVNLFGAGIHQVSQLTEAQFETFHDQRAMAHLPEDVIDNEVLDAIRAKRAVGIPLTTEDNEAMDRTNPRRGIVRNRRKRWATRKADSGIVIP